MDICRHLAKITLLIIETLNKKGDIYYAYYTRNNFR